MLKMTQFQGSYRPLYPLVGQQGVWGGMEPGGPCCRRKEWQRSAPSPRHPELQESGCKVVIATWHSSLAGNIMIFIVYRTSEWLAFYWPTVTSS